jgi:hypothetical protein
MLDSFSHLKPTLLLIGVLAWGAVSAQVPVLISGNRISSPASLEAYKDMGREGCNE